MKQVLSGGGMVVGPYHGGGGVHLPFQDTGRYIEEEGMEINIPRELYESKAIHSFSGTNASVLNEILKLAGLSISDQVTTVKFGDIVICVRSAWDDTIRRHVGTIEEILHTINTSNGCKPIMVNGKGIMDNGNTKSNPSSISHLTSSIKKNSGRLPNGIIPREKDMEAINPNSDRWKKKKQRIEELSNNIHKLRLNVSRDVQDDDERTALTALVVAVMDRTAERIGNDDSADNGHFGVTGFRKKHISVVGPKVHLDYVGKSGTVHEKSFSDVRIARALKKAIRNAPGKFIFETSDGFRIKSDKVNRYLEPFNISAKDLRGYNANKWIIKKLSSQKSKVTSEQPEKAKKERKKIFNKAVKEVAMRVGHGSGTLKKHYMIPELPIQYVEHGRIIDMKNLGYYKEGAVIESPELSKGIEVEKEHKNLYEEIKKRLAAKGIAMPITEQEFYSEIAKVHIKERKDYYDLLEKYVEKYTNKNTKSMKDSKIRSSILEIINSDTLKKDELIYEAMDALIGLKGTLMLFAGKIDKKPSNALIKTDPEEAIKISIEQLNIIEKIYEKYLEYQKASGIEKLHEGGPTDISTIEPSEESPMDIEAVDHLPSSISHTPSKECGCFFVFIRKENPELVEKIIETDINSNPELRQQFDQEYKKWNGGKL